MPRPKFKEPQLKDSGSTWYVTWYTYDQQGKSTRHRRTGDMNTIADLKARRRYGLQLVDSILQELRAGPVDKPQASTADPFRLGELFAEGVHAKLRSDRPHTQRVYRSIDRMFCAWLEKQGWANRAAADFTTSQALRFLETNAQSRKWSNTTFNNVRDKMRALWNEMILRSDSLKDSPNPFVKIPARKQRPTDRRPFTLEERLAAIEWLRANDPSLELFVLIMFYGLLRPTECLQLRRFHLDIKAGVIVLPAGLAKDNEERRVTLPTHLLPRLAVWEQVPEYHFLFGSGLEPSPREGHYNTLWRRHDTMICALVLAGAMLSRVGVGPYSWKYTGISWMQGRVPEVAIVDQAGHSDSATTRIYYRKPLVSTSIREVEDAFQVPMKNH